MVKVISLPYISQVLYVLYFTRPRYQVSVYRTIGPHVFLFSSFFPKLLLFLSILLLYTPERKASVYKQTTCIAQNGSVSRPMFIFICF